MPPPLPALHRSPSDSPHPPIHPRKEQLPKGTEDDALDPLARQAAQLAPPMFSPSLPVTLATSANAPAPAPMPGAALSLEQILPQLVRKLALAGDGKRATVRVEIGAGALAGATVVVSNESGGIRVDVEAPASLSGADRAAWSDRIRARLEAKGLRVDSIKVEGS